MLLGSEGHDQSIKGQQLSDQQSCCCSADLGIQGAGFLKRKEFLIDC